MVTVQQKFFLIIWKKKKHQTRLLFFFVGQRQCVPNETKKIKHKALWIRYMLVGYNKQERQTMVIKTWNVTDEFQVEKKKKQVQTTQKGPKLKHERERSPQRQF